MDQSEIHRAGVDDRLGPSAARKGCSVPKFQCLSCGGVYESVGGDSVEYTHVCPPLSDYEVARAANLLPADPAAAFDPGALTPAERAVFQAWPRTRPGARDERVDPSRVPRDVGERAQLRDPEAILVNPGLGRREIKP